MLETARIQEYGPPRSDAEGKRPTRGGELMRLKFVLLTALALALLTATGSFVLSAKQFVGATSPAASESTFDDDRGGGAVAVVSQPLFVAALFALALATLPRASSRGVVSKPRRARGPPPL
jgi:hypothetical protein